MEMKNVITINLENAPSQIVVERMCAKGVEGPIHKADARHVIRYSSPPNVIRDQSFLLILINFLLRKY